MLFILVGCQFIDLAPWEPTQSLNSTCYSTGKIPHSWQRDTYVYIYIYICCCFRCFLHQLMNALAADMTTATWENSQKVFRTWTKTQLLHAGAVLDIAVCLVATLCQIMSFRAQWTDCVASCRRELTDCGCQWREALKNRPLFSSNVRGGGDYLQMWSF